MAKLLYKFRINSHDPLTPTDCDLCRLGGEYRVKVGAPELRDSGAVRERWEPGKEYGAFFPDKHLIILHPSLLAHPVKLWETFWHEYLHALDHAEASRTKHRKKFSTATPWHLNHETIFRISRAMSKFMVENNLEIVQRKVVKYDNKKVLE